MNAFVLHLRDQEVGGAVTSGHLYRVDNGSEVDWDDRLPDFTTATQGQRLIVLVHGYNNSLSFGRTRLTRFMKMLSAGGNTDVMLAVLWPGDGWAKALSYPFEARDADDTATALFKWICIHVDKTARIAFVGHSLGCRVVMNTAQQLARQMGAARLDRICLMAPALDNDCLGRTDITCYKEATLAANRVAVLASEEDLVLHFAYPLGDLIHTILLGERWGTALGRTGPLETEANILSKVEPVPKADPMRDIDHGDYLDVDQNRQPPQTIAESENFVIEFLDRRPNPRWPAQRS